MGTTDWFSSYGLYLILGIVAVAGLGFFYIRTPAGKYQWDKIMLRAPIIGRILLLSELSRACRTMALLFKVGLPLPDVLSLAIQGTSNKAMAEVLTGVQHELIRGEGLSKPMSRRPLFLPLMVQMVGVGEETGNLDNTLTTVAESYEMEADDSHNDHNNGIGHSILYLLFGGGPPLNKISHLSEHNLQIATPLAGSYCPGVYLGKDPRVSP